jgi:uncharacterized protein (UPF0332 family)
MSILADDFFKFSEKISNSEIEFDWRNACSRTYYGAYHLAQVAAALCPDVNQNFKMGSHERLSERFKSHSSINGKSIAIMLEAMKKLRRIADYEITDPFDKNFCMEQLAAYKLLRQKLISFEESNTSKVSA